MAPVRLAWVGHLFRLRPARVPIGHSIRSAIAVGGPFVWGALTDNILTGMWIGMGGLMMAPGEREGSHRLNVTIVLVATPIGAAGYLVGFVQGWPLWALMPLMAALAFGCGAIPAYGPALSVAGMQFLLIAAIAMGVPGIDWWGPIGWYVVGSAIYLVLMLAEFAVDRRRPERHAAGAVVRSLDALADAREKELAGAGHGEATGGRRAEAFSAIEAARVVLRTGRPLGPSEHWDALSRLLDAAESIAALLIGTSDPVAVRVTRNRLERNGIRSGSAGSAATTDDVLDRRMDELERAAADVRLGLMVPAPAPGAPGPPPAPTAGAWPDRLPWRERLTLGPDAVGAAARLSLVYGLAVGARAYFPYPHWFWVPLTVCLVMKPDFGSVFGRAVLRIVGTAGGVVIATGVIAVANLPAVRGDAALVISIAITLLAAAVPWFMMRSYALQAVAIAPIVILLVAVIQPEGAEINYSAERIGATVVGGVLVLVFGYALWPGARRTDVTGRLGAAIVRLEDYLRAAMSPISGDRSPDALRHRRLVDARHETYAALADLRTQLQRALGEAPPASARAATWIPAVAAVERLADGVSDYAAARVRGERPDSEPDLVAVLRRLDELRAGDAEQVRAAAIDLRHRLTGLKRCS